MTYQAPINLISYLLHTVCDFDALANTDKYKEISPDLAGDILSAANAYASEVLAPINRDGDLHGAKLQDGKVVAAPGFKAAYEEFITGGWQGISADEEIGGMGLPHYLSIGVSEMFYAANMAFGLCPMLTASAINAIHSHASDNLKEQYLPKMVTGEWSGAMNLTEPQAGSDLGALKCKAKPNEDGSYAISGQKIFITWGDHNLTDNIIHLVLARLPDAPAGSRGISLFLVPKILSDGMANKVTAIGLEHKMGIHASPTCVMEFDGAKGWLVGQENKGLACMFTMMNEARLYVGVQGVAIGERAYQQALAYANERVQGRVLDAKPDTPIIGHADIRRMLLDMKSGLAGARAINMATAYATDMSHSAGDENLRKKYAIRAALLTPIAKSYGSDMGVYATSLGVQIHGGMGYIEETGAAQHYRDARIAPIYEGTNGIQALDLVFRKLKRDAGAGMKDLIAELEGVLDDVEQMNERIDQNGRKLDFGCKQKHLSAGIESLKMTTDLILTMNDKDAHAASVPYLNLCAEVISGALLIKSVVSGYKKNMRQAQAMQKLVWHHSLRYLSKAPAWSEQIKYGAAPVFSYPQDRLLDL